MTIKSNENEDATGQQGKKKKKEKKQETKQGSAGLAERQREVSRAAERTGQISDISFRLNVSFFIAFATCLLLYMSHSHTHTHIHSPLTHTYTHTHAWAAVSWRSFY